MPAISSTKKNKNTDSKHKLHRALIAGLAIVVVTLAIYLIMIKNEQATTLNRQAAEKPAKIVTKDIDKQPASDSATAIEKTVETPAEEQPAEQPAEEPRSFEFVEMVDWREVSSKDGSYKISVSSYATLGACKDDASVLMVGMIYLDGSSGVSDKYSCGSVLSALSAKNPQLTRTAFGVEKKSEVPQDAKTDEVTLVAGLRATRYEYTSKEDGSDYNNIKYVASHEGSDYVAHMRWATSYNVYGGSDAFYSPNTFDTIAQKTWQF